MKKNTKEKLIIQEQVERYFQTLFDSDLHGGVLEVAPQNHMEYRYYGNRDASQNTAARLLLKYPGNSVFVSLNAYRRAAGVTSGVRCRDNLWRVGVIMLDIDGNKGLCGKEQDTIGVLRWLWEHGKIPTPNLYSFTGGGGIHLYYTLQSMPKQMEKSVRVLKEVLANLLIPYMDDLPFNETGGYHIDTKTLDSQRVDRVPGSINPKTGNRCVCFTTEKNERYSYRELLELVCEGEQWEGNRKLRDLRAERDKMLGKSPSKKKGSAPKHCSEERSKQLSLNRMNALFRLAKSGKDFYECREMACFLLQNWCAQAEVTVEQTTRYLQALNTYFYEPLSDQELFITSSAAKAYFYTNESIAQALLLTSDEQKVMFPSRRPGNRKSRTIAEKMAIAKLTLQDLTIREVSQKTGLSESIIKRRRVEMKNGKGFVFWSEYYRNLAREAKNKLLKDMESLYTTKSSFCHCIISSLIEDSKQGDVAGLLPVLLLSG